MHAIRFEGNRVVLSAYFQQVTGYGQVQQGGNTHYEEAPGGFDAFSPYPDLFHRLFYDHKCRHEYQQGFNSSRHVLDLSMTKRMPVIRGFGRFLNGKKRNQGCYQIISRMDSLRDNAY